MDLTINQILTIANLFFAGANAYIAYRSWQYGDQKSALIGASIATLCITAVLL